MLKIWPKKADCPEYGELVDFVEKFSYSKSIEEHIHVCPKCKKKAEQIILDDLFALEFFYPDIFKHFNIVTPTEEENVHIGLKPAARDISNEKG